MKAYDAVLSFCDKSEVVVEVQVGGTYTGIWDFDPVTGIFTFDGDNLMLQNNLHVTIKASIDYQLDYNGVVATDKDHEGNNKNIEIKFTIKAEKKPKGLDALEEVRALGKQGRPHLLYGNKTKAEQAN